MNSFQTAGKGSSKFRSAFLFACIYFVMEMFMITNHEMWRDELQAWSIAQDSHSIPEVISNSMYEGHGKLWFILLFILQIFTEQVFFMQVFHLLIASLAVFVFLFYSPFKLFTNILFCLGYFFAFEYSLISRNYSLEILLLFLSLGIYLQKGNRHLLWTSVILFMFVQVNIYSIITGALFGAYVLFQTMQTKPVQWRSLFSFLLILVSGISLAVYFIIPPTDGGFASQWKTGFDYTHYSDVVTTIYGSYSPLPLPELHFWNTNILFYCFYDDEIRFRLSIFLFFFFCIYFRRSPSALLLYIICTLCLLLFFYSKFFGVIRHQGHLYLVLVMCLWIDEHSRILSPAKKTTGILLRSVKRFEAFIIFLLLLTQVIATSFAFYFELAFPFSNAKAAAKYIRSQSLDALPVIASHDSQTSPIAGFLNKNFYYPDSERHGKYIIWNDSRREKPEAEFKAAVEQFGSQTESSFLAITNFPVELPPENWIMLKHFDHAIVVDENYFIYFVKKETTLSTDLL